MHHLTSRLWATLELALVCEKRMASHFPSCVSARGWATVNVELFSYFPHRRVFSLRIPWKVHRDIRKGNGIWGSRNNKFHYLDTWIYRRIRRQVTVDPFLEVRSQHVYVRKTLPSTFSLPSLCSFTLFPPLQRSLILQEASASLFFMKTRWQSIKFYTLVAYASSSIRKTGRNLCLIRLKSFYLATLALYTVN